LALRHFVPGESAFRRKSIQLILLSRQNFFELPDLGLYATTFSDARSGCNQLSKA